MFNSCVKHQLTAFLFFWLSVSLLLHSFVHRSAEFSYQFVPSLSHLYVHSVSPPHFISHLRATVSPLNTRSSGHTVTTALGNSVQIQINAFILIQSSRSSVDIVSDLCVVSHTLLSLTCNIYPQCITVLCVVDWVSSSSSTPVLASIRHWINLHSVGVCFGLCLRVQCVFVPVKVPSSGRIHATGQSHCVSCQCSSCRIWCEFRLWLQICRRTRTHSDPEESVL